MSDPMSDTPQPEDVPPIVHALLVCRNATPAAEGRLDLEEVLEVIALDALPGDAGPLTFVAFTRNVPAGTTTFTFVIRSAVDPEQVVARYPLDVEVPSTLSSRQVAVQVKIPSIPVKQGGWFLVVFEWEGKALAANQFAIGAKETAPAE